jgi:hypothetical protein
MQRERAQESELARAKERDIEALQMQVRQLLSTLLN